MRLLGVFVVATVTYLSLSQGLSLFVWHPILMSVGVSGLNFFQLFRKKSIIPQNLEDKNQPF